jgi:hypothetical protein
LPCLPFNETPEKGGFPVGAPFAEKGYEKGKVLVEKIYFPIRQLHVALDMLL